MSSSAHITAPIIPAVALAVLDWIMAAPSIQLDHDARWWALGSIPRPAHLILCLAVTAIALVYLSGPLVRPRAYAAVIAAAGMLAADLTVMATGNFPPMETIELPLIISGGLVIRALRERPIRAHTDALVEVSSAIHYRAGRLHERYLHRKQNEE